MDFFFPFFTLSLERAHPKHIVQLPPVGFSKTSSHFLGLYTAWTKARRSTTAGAGGLAWSMGRCNCCQSFSAVIQSELLAFSFVPLLCAADIFPSMEWIKHFSQSRFQGASISRQCGPLLLTPKKNNKPLALITAGGRQYKNVLFQKQYQFVVYTISLVTSSQHWWKKHNFVVDVKTFKATVFELTSCRLRPKHFCKYCREASRGRDVGPMLLVTNR